MAEEYMIEQDEITELADSDVVLVTTHVSDPTPLSEIISWASLKTLISNYITTLFTPKNGWIAGTGTWSYSSADSPSFVMSVPDADAALFGLGDRIWLTQTTSKFFIVTAKGSPSGGFTPVTIYGGTDYTLANATITSPRFSHEKSPLGFPMDKTKWRVTLTDTSDRSQASPAQGAWYNTGSLSLTIPIGQWRVYWEASLQVQATTTTSLVAGFAGSLSTANNTESDNEFTGRYTFSLPASTTNATGRAGVHAEKILTLASKTPYYLIASTGAAGISSLGFVGNLAPIKIVAECTYL